MAFDQTVAAFTGPHPPIEQGDYVPFINISRDQTTGHVRVHVRGLQSKRGEPCPEASISMDPIQFRAFAVDLCASELSDE